MKNILFTIGIMLWAVVSVAQEKGRIELEVSGIPSDQGSVLAALFNDPEGFPNDVAKGVMKVASQVKGNRAVLALPDVPFGTYVLAVFHDENGNGQLDTNKRGIPVEALGVSNNVRLKLGPPKYDKALFDFSTDKLEMVIELQQYRTGE